MERRESALNLNPNCAQNPSRFVLGLKGGMEEREWEEGDAHAERERECEQFKRELERECV